MAKKHYRYVLAFDPSGTFNEGKGVTGWVLMDDTGKIMKHGYIEAANFDTIEEYWEAHVTLLENQIDLYKDQLMVVIEDYLLYADKLAAQTYSRMETCRLIGVLQMTCYQNHNPYVFQRAVDVKTRWSNEVLRTRDMMQYKGKHNGFIINYQGVHEVLIKHELDAFRHAMHYITFKNVERSTTKTASVKRFDSYRNKK